VSSPAAGPTRLVAATLGGSLGTIQRALGGGVQTYVGLGSLRSPSADAPLVARPGEWYVVAGYREDVVFYDALVEAPPRNADVEGARQRTWVGELSAGLGWRTEHVAAEYRYTVRGREYAAEPSSHAYGSITVSLVRGRAIVR
jgi:hypothetical protein